MTGYDSSGAPTGTQVTVPSVPGEEKLAGTYTLTGTTTPVSGLAATVTYGTTNPNATTALPAETVTNSYSGQDQLGIVSSNLKQAYLRGAGYTEFGELAQAQLGNLGSMVIQSLFRDPVTRRVVRADVDREVSGPGNLSSTKYTYDLAGNITRVLDEQNDFTVKDDQCFAYDWAARLSEAWTSGDNCTTKPVNGSGSPNLGTVDPYWTSWTFTDTGQRATETQHKAGPVAADTTRTHTYPTTVGAAQGHALRSVTATGGATDTYGYDATGNMTGKTPATGSAQTMTWNDEGDLASSTTAGATTSFLYDTTGTRILKREPTATTLYLPGGQELVLDKTTGTVSGTRYYSVPGGTAMRTSTDGRVRFLVADHHGTNTLSIAASTLAFNRRKQLPYGGERGAPPAAWPSQKGFVGGDIDKTTGLTHIGARDYDTKLGQFISADPLLSLDQPQSLNGYNYANNNPVTNSDPTGERNEECGTLYNCPNGNRITFSNTKEITYRSFDSQYMYYESSVGLKSGPEGWNRRTISSQIKQNMSWKPPKPKPVLSSLRDILGGMGQGLADLNSLANHLNPAKPLLDALGAPDSGDLYRSGTNALGLDTESQDYEVGELLSPAPGGVVAHVAAKVAKSGKGAIVAERIATSCNKCFLAGTKILMADGTNKKTLKTSR
ncbi:hypothetical protein GCM10020254_00670 [Streptomyces goshikiensis]